MFWLRNKIIKFSLHTLYLSPGKCSKIWNTFFFLYSNKMFVFRAGIHNMLVRIANRGDPDQSDLGLRCINKYTLYL